MATITFTESATLCTETCINCGILFAVPKEYQLRRQQDQKIFCCPNGHNQHYSGKTEAEKVREELKRKEQELADEVRRRLFAQSELEKKTRDLKRLHKGVCPCCNRSFLNLQRHMKTKHPDKILK